MQDVFFSDDKKSLIFYAYYTKNIHIFNIATNEDKTIDVPFPLSVHASLADNQQFVVSKVDSALLLDVKSQKTEDLGGSFIGLGSF